MHLQRLEIYRQYDNSIKGKIEFKSDLGKIEYNLDDIACAAVTAVCGKELARIARLAAEEMSVKIFDLTPLISDTSE